MNYFERVKPEYWNILDAYNSLAHDLVEHSTEQRLSIFHELLSKQDNNTVKAWLESWKKFAKRVHERENRKQPNSSKQQSESSQQQSKPSQKHSGPSQKQPDPPQQQSHLQAFTFNSLDDSELKVNNYINNYTFDNNSQTSNNNKRELEDEEAEPEPEPKRKNISRSDSTTSVESVETQEEITVTRQPIWEERLTLKEELMQDANLFEYNPLVHNVIRLGYGMHPIQGVDYDIYYDTLNHYSEVTPNKFLNKNDIIKGNEKWLDLFIDSITFENMENNLESIRGELGVGSDLRGLLYRALKIVQTIYDPSHPDIAYSEAVLNSNVLAPLVQSIARLLYPKFKTMFYRGEEKLKCLLSQLRKIDPSVDARHGYNADGVIRIASLDNMEILITELSSGYGKIDKSKHSCDHYKGMFGLLSMYKAIADQYRHASFSSLMKVKVFFLQSYNDCIYFWSLTAVEKNLFCLFREKKVNIPYKFEDRKDSVLNWVLFVNELKIEIDKSLGHLQQLKDEHEANIVTRRYQEEDEYETLNNIINPTIIHVSRLSGHKGMANQEPMSSPIFY